MHCIFLLSFLLTTCVSFGQIVNIENKRLLDDTSGWSGSLDASISAAQNDELFYSAGFRPRVQYKTRKNYWFLLSDLSYTGSQTKTYANSGMSHLRYARRLNNGPMKWESYTQVQYNELLNQKMRALGGTGLRWKFIDTNNIRFFIGTSTFYEYEELQDEQIVNKAFRWSSYLSWLIHLKSGFYFTSVNYVQPNLADFDDVRYSGQFTLGMAIAKHLDFRFETSIYYDSRPPTGVRAFVFSSSAGIRVRLGE
jgi:hypothetical protein